MPLVTKQKATGSHYTPPELACFLAERLVAEADFRQLPELRVLDPACGDGELLVALANSLPDKILKNTVITGIELDELSLGNAQERLEAFESKSNFFKGMDFLELYTDTEAQIGLFNNGPPTNKTIPPVDIIIANPPYVRTQVLGARKSQELAKAFRLKGRIDLYQAFLVAMTQCLKDRGIIGVITSNRFISTKGGASIRAFIAENYEIVELIDLGDTKLFEAAVLPAILIARKLPSTSRSSTNPSLPNRFVRIYENRASNRDDREELVHVGSVYDILRKNSDGEYLVSKTRFKLSTGTLSFSNLSSEPWQMVTETEKGWIGKIESAAKYQIGDVVKVRVGIKTTADQVFIRSDWDDMPKDRRPEDCLLRLIFSHDDAGRWRSSTRNESLKKILYTHEVRDAKRVAVDIERYPCAAAYLRQYRERLERRKYVIKANRKWYEIWVPQDPLALRRPKLIFPDISPSPMFFFDNEGLMVDGNCYWIVSEEENTDMLFLIQGVANSNLMTHYHELVFNNKLYAGRRRYLTQYVEKYPMPDRHSAHSRRIVDLVKKLVSDDVGDNMIEKYETDLEIAVAEAFGVEPLPSF